MAQFFQDNIPLLAKDSGTQISIPATYNGQPARARCGGQSYRWTSTLTCNLSTTGFGALDTGTLAANTLYYVYLCVSSNAVGLVSSLSAPATGPTGFTQFRYIGKFKTQNGSAAVADLAVVNAMVGNGDELPAVNTTEWVSYTPTFSGVTITSNGSYYRRVGSDIEVNIDISATADATTTVLFNMLGGISGLTVNTTKLGSRAAVGSGAMATAGNNVVFIPTYSGSGDTCSFRLQDDGVLSNTSPTVVGGVDSGDRILFVARYPVNEWTGLFS